MSEPNGDLEESAIRYLEADEVDDFVAGWMATRSRFTSLSGAQWLQQPSWKRLFEGSWPIAWADVKPGPLFTNWAYLRS